MLHVYFNFPGTAEEVVNYYKTVFKTDEPQITRFKDMPAMPGFELPAEMAEKVAHTQLNIADSVMMFSDTFPGTPLVVGNHVSVMVTLKDRAELERIFTALSAEGAVTMPLNKTSWSEAYGALVDKYSTQWQMMLEE